MKPVLALALVIHLLALTACERKTIVVELLPATPPPKPQAMTKTIETTRLGEAIGDFGREPTTENLADVKKAFAELDGEIAELEAYVAKHTGTERAEADAKHRNLTVYRAAELQRFEALQAKAKVLPAAPDARSGAEKIEDSLRRAGEKVEDTAKGVGDAVKDAVRQ